MGGNEITRKTRATMKILTKSHHNVMVVSSPTTVFINSSRHPHPIGGTPIFVLVPVSNVVAVAWIVLGKFVAVTVAVATEIPVHTTTVPFSVISEVGAGVFAGCTVVAMLVATVAVAMLVVVVVVAVVVGSACVVCVVIDESQPLNFQLT